MKEYINLAFDKLAILDGFGWFIDMNYNLLFKIDLSDDHIESVGNLPVNNGLRYQYRRIVIFDKKLVIIPYNSNVILIYDITNEKYEEIELDKQYLYKNNGSAFSDAYVHGDDVFFIPARYKAIVRLSMRDMKIYYISEPMKKVYLRTQNENRHFFSGSYLVEGERLCIPLWQSGDILKVDMKTYDGDIESLDDIKHGIYSIFNIKQKLIVLPKEETKIIIIDKENKIRKEVVDISTLGSYASEILIMNEGYVLLSANGEEGRILWFDEKFENSKIIYSLGKKYVDYKLISPRHVLKGVSYSQSVENDNKLYVYSQLEGCLLVINRKELTVRKIETKIKKDKEIMNQIRHVFKLRDEMIKETEFCNLEEFVSLISNY